MCLFSTMEHVMMKTYLLKLSQECMISLRHSVNGDFCGYSSFVLWHQYLTTFVSWAHQIRILLGMGVEGGRVCLNFLIGYAENNRQI